jgi:hypothetical protein
MLNALKRKLQEQFEIDDDSHHQYPENTANNKMFVLQDHFYRVFALVPELQ